MFPEHECLNIVFVFYLTLEKRSFLHLFLFTEKSRDASYLGKILEGFTLTQKPAEEKTVSIFKRLSLSVCEMNSSLTSVSVCRSSLPPLCPGTIARSIVSVRQSMSRVFPGSVPRWPRLWGPPGVTWSKRSPSKEDATSWTQARGGRCWEKTFCKVEQESVYLQCEETTSGFLVLLVD